MAEETDDVVCPHGGAAMSIAASAKSNHSGISGNPEGTRSQGIMSEASSSPSRCGSACETRLVSSCGRATWRSNASVDTARLDDIVASEGMFESTGMLLVYAAEGQGEDLKEGSDEDQSEDDTGVSGSRHVKEDGPTVGSLAGLSQEKVATPVSLNVYDLSKSSLVGLWNRTAGGLGVGGAFHVGVEIFDQEWSYGWTQTGSGIACCPPHRHPNHIFLVSVPLGQICCSRLELLNALRCLGSWSGQDYNVIHHNCIHFAEALVDHLGVGPLPRWVATLSKHMEAVTSPIKRLCGGTLLRPAAIEQRASTDSGLETLEIGSGSKSSSSTGVGTSVTGRPPTSTTIETNSITACSANSFGMTRKCPKTRRSTTTPTATTCTVQ